ncbi:MAG: DoxX family protein [Fidelibacterota bacterium]
MELLLNIIESRDGGLLALRVGVGIIFLVHGRMKWAMWKMEPSEQMPAQMLSLMKFLSVVEPLGGAAVMAGFLTRVSAVGLGIIMVGAIVSKKKMLKVSFAEQERTGWELDFILLGACVALLLSGGGGFAVDHVLFSVP